MHEDLLGHGLSLNDVTSFLDECCDCGVMVREDDKYLALAIPENRHW